MKNNNALLSVKNLSTFFSTAEGVAKAVQEVSFDIRQGGTLALVGESGCGKSVTALSIMRLVPAPGGRIVSGTITFDGQNLPDLPERQMRRIRGNNIAMIFQEPMTSLNPVYTIGNQIVEAIRRHREVAERRAWQLAIDLLGRVGIPEAKQRILAYPHQLSGGMCQRVMIAMAISCEPRLLIADEPTTALDVTVQAQILDLLDELRQNSQMSILLITHDLSIVAERAETIAVMYASRIVETASAEQLFEKPLHPYTRGLLDSVPRLGTSAKRLHTIPGTVPDPLDFPTGCKFHPRCPIGCDDRRCQTAEPQLRQVQPGRCAACWYAPNYETQKER